ncbi:uncharacterized protein LOC134535332 [Bacillus rossius redtenbacheri]|uniref:uncharacterized protein LOC134535332 n=1 Tax=Bacillus rossius redtenbacheri TaxID=93214 RepID=UPI002FDE2879
MCADLVAYSPRSSDSVVEVTLVTSSPSVDEDVHKMENERKGEPHQTLTTSKIEGATETPDFVSNGHLSSRSEYEHYKDHFDKVMEEFNHHISKIESRYHKKEIAQKEDELLKQHQDRDHIEESSEQEARKPRATMLLITDLNDDVFQDVSEFHLKLHSLLKLKNAKEDKFLKIHHVNSRPAKSTSCCSCGNFDCKKNVPCDDSTEKVSLYNINNFNKEAGFSDSEREHCKTTDKSEYLARFKIYSPRSMRSSKQSILQDENFAAKGDCGEIDKLATKLENLPISSKCMTTKPSKKDKQYDTGKLSARVRDETESECGTASINKSRRPSDLPVYPEARKTYVKSSALQAVLQHALQIKLGGVTVCNRMSAEEMTNILKNRLQKMLVQEKNNADGKANRNSCAEDGIKEKRVHRKDESEFFQCNRCDGMERRNEVFGNVLLDDVDQTNEVDVLQFGDTRSGAPGPKKVGRPVACDCGDGKDETMGRNADTPRDVEEDRGIGRRSGRTRDHRDHDVSPPGKKHPACRRCGAAGDAPRPREDPGLESPREAGSWRDSSLADRRLSPRSGPGASPWDAWSVPSATGSSVSVTSSRWRLSWEDAFLGDQLQLAPGGTEESCVRQAARRLLQLLELKQLEGQVVLTASSFGDCVPLRG